MNSDDPRHTYLEADDELARVQAELRRQAQPPFPQKMIEEEAFSPSSRPPLALLTVFDDGLRTGEVVRIRGNRFLIGRTEGDLQFSADDLISARHLEITKQLVGGSYRLVITDLQSRNGLFAKISKGPLAHQAEFLIGGGHYRFEVLENDDTENSDASIQHSLTKAPVTRAFEVNTLPLANAFLSELLSQGKGVRLALNEDEYWIGRDLACNIRRPDDQFTAAKHAVLKRTSTGRWIIENNRSRNGVWLKMPLLQLEPGNRCEFRIGEQLFHLQFGT